MAFFGPALVLLTLFLFLPMVLTLVFSFTDYFALNPDMTHFVGLENYINIFKDELFVKSFFNTVKFVIIIVPCQCIGALVLALAINKVTHCKKYFKVAFFIPVVMSLAVVSTLFPYTTLFRSQRKPFLKLILFSSLFSRITFQFRVNPFYRFIQFCLRKIGRAHV